ncbi:hypothetical protein C7Y72_06090 [Paraconexibacter algicola]|uniref:N-acetyltransferase domain-containing protein n=1 Tax=Paraconexibacter algicola TaxID=2133960 RepID=A0A2T4UJ32_9ACTN|nr:hypothetical protein C7Y72_06090 [Paraconexibacter algicola]
MADRARARRPGLRGDGRRARGAGARGPGRVAAGLPAVAADRVPGARAQRRGERRAVRRHPRRQRPVPVQARARGGGRRGQRRRRPGRGARAPGRADGRLRGDRACRAAPLRLRWQAAGPVPFNRPISPRLRLDGERTAIRPFAARDLDDLLALRQANRAFLEPYESTRDARFFTAEGQSRELRLDREAWTTGQGYGFAILDTTGEVDRLIGRIAVANVVLGSWRNATIGYWVDEASGSRGHATEAVQLALRFCFEELGLHRVQAAVMPHNERSLRVVGKCGLRQEGVALGYLEINGRWEDHVIFAMTLEEWRARQS